jgi:DNA-binding PadR family transcriptional regulator
MSQDEFPLISGEAGSPLQQEVGDVKTLHGVGLSFLDLVMLSLLGSASMTGYVLKRRLAAQYRMKASYATLYSRLKALEKEGILGASESFGEFASRNSGINYKLTPLGKTLLEQNLQKIDGSLKKIRLKEL